MPTASEFTRQMHECCRGRGLCISLLALGCFGFWGSQTFVFRDNLSSVVYHDSSKTSKSVEHLVQETNLSALRDAEGSLNRRDLRSSGFLYIGFGDRHWCAESQKSVQSLRRAKLGCRSKEPKDEAFCKIAFVSEQAQINTMRAECPEQFEAFVAVDLQGCPLAGIQDARAKKMCVRALGVAPFDYNVFMDMDTLIVAPNVEEVFAVLRRGFQLASAFECCAKGDLAESTVLHGDADWCAGIFEDRRSQSPRKKRSRSTTTAWRASTPVPASRTLRRRPWSRPEFGSSRCHPDST